MIEGDIEAERAETVHGVEKPRPEELKSSDLSERRRLPLHPRSTRNLSKRLP